jgi:predicted enzyme related to lactoylglutathione lyase
VCYTAIPSPTASGGPAAPAPAHFWGENAVANQVVWVDIPVLDLDRACRFYSAVLGGTVTKQEYPGFTIGLLPGFDSDVSGCLFAKDDEKPSDRGLLIYLNAQGRLDEAIAVVEANGGKVLQPRHQIGPHGYRAVILDSEGNRLALHSR